MMKFIRNTPNVDRLERAPFDKLYLRCTRDDKEIIILEIIIRISLLIDIKRHRTLLFDIL